MRSIHKFNFWNFVAWHTTCIFMNHHAYLVDTYSLMYVPTYICFFLFLDKKATSVMDIDNNINDLEYSWINQDRWWMGYWFDYSIFQINKNFSTLTLSRKLFWTLKPQRGLLEPAQLPMFSCRFHAALLFPSCKLLHLLLGKRLSSSPHGLFVYHPKSTPIWCATSIHSKAHQPRSMINHSTSINRCTMIQLLTYVHDFT